MTNPLASKPFLDLMKPLIDNGMYSIRRDGRLRRMIMGHRADSPWLHANPGHPENPTGGDCNIWNDVFWDCISKKRMIHSNCQECYKVVLAPRTLVELMRVYDFQQSEPWPCKCGVETRGDLFVSSTYLPVEHLGVCKLYGAYWYCKGLEAGRERWRYVKDWADEVFGVDMHGEGEVSVILKRACTEFERSCGPSDQWTVTPEQEYLEAQVKEHIVWRPMDLTQPRICHEQTIVRWIEWAYGHADETYKHFTGGRDLYPGYVTYQDKRPAEWMNDSIFDLGCSPRVAYVLWGEGIMNIGDLGPHTMKTVSAMTGIGPKSLAEIQTKLNAIGLALEDGDQEG